MFCSDSLSSKSMLRNSITVEAQDTSLSLNFRVLCSSACVHELGLDALVSAVKLGSRIGMIHRFACSFAPLAADINQPAFSAELRSSLVSPQPNHSAVPDVEMQYHPTAAYTPVAELNPPLQQHQLLKLLQTLRKAPAGYIGMVLDVLLTQDVANTPIDVLVSVVECTLRLCETGIRHGIAHAASRTPAPASTPLPPALQSLPPPVMAPHLHSLTTPSTLPPLTLEAPPPQSVATPASLPALPPQVRNT
jgi:hypothetical protein